MKRLVLFILSILYLGTSTQANLYFHFCMGELANWGVGENEEKSCAKCGMDKDEREKNNCCKDEVKTLKLCLDQKPSPGKVFISHHTLIRDLHVTGFLHEHLLMEKRQLVSLQMGKAPPLANDPAYYLRFCNFRI